MLIATKYGKLRGLSLPGNIHAFLGVPFAASPCGARRYAPPAPPESWVGERDASRFGSVPPQDDRDPNGFYQKEFPFIYGPKDEEGCLNLNIWTPDAGSMAKLPVMVWFHGGAFNHGAGSDPVFDGARLAAKGVVVVTANYRLGLLGYLAHPALEAEAEGGVSGNYGLLDQIAALVWVRENIAAFGGDPDCVTAFGQSAGGMSVIDMIASPDARGLMHRAIVQSGSMAFSPGSKPLSYEKTRDDYARDLAAVGITSAKDLRAMRIENILEFQRSRRTMPLGGGWALPSSPADAILKGNCLRVPVMAGYAANESGAGYTPQSRMAIEDYRARVKAAAGDLAEKILSLYPARDDRETVQMTMALSADESYLGAAGLLDAATKNGRAAYGYRFAMSPPGLNGSFIGAFHSSELAYVFGTLDKIPRPWRECDRTLSDKILQAFASFARTGAPEIPGAAWPTWETGQMLTLGETIEPAGKTVHERAYALAALYA